MAVHSVCSWSHRQAGLKPQPLAGMWATAAARCPSPPGQCCCRMCIGVAFVLLGLYSKENVTAGDVSRALPQLLLLAAQGQPSPLPNQWALSTQLLLWCCLHCSCAPPTAFSWSWAASAWACCSSRLPSLHTACGRARGRAESGEALWPCCLGASPHVPCCGCKWCSSAHLPTLPDLPCPPPPLPTHCLTTSLAPAAPWPLLPPGPPACRSARQTYFARTAGLLLGLQIAYSTAFVAAYASVVASQNCDYPWSALSGLTFLQVLPPLLPGWPSCRCHRPGCRCLPAAAKCHVPEGHHY